MTQVSPVFASFFVALVLSSCAPPTIEQADVERIITTLASDEMEGRRAFTPAADRAAEFIRREFAAIGLESLEGERDHLQRFTVYTVQVQEVRVLLGGAVVSQDRVVAWLASDSIRWSQETDLEVVRIGPGDEARAAVRGAFRGSGDRIVFVHSAHQNTFERYRRFRSGGARFLERGSGPNVVMVLADEPPSSFEVTATANTLQDELKNVVGVIPGRRPDEIVLFSAHYDHIGIQRAVNGDSIANGANDNASGTTAVITLARYFKALGRQERTLVFAAFTAEEGGGYGSRYFSSQVDPDQIVAMFNIEMIGKPGKDGPNTAWITGFERSTFGTILQEAVEGTAFAFYADPYPDENLFFRSDNATLARLGVPAHSVSTTPIDVDQEYHQVTDQVETLDLAHLTATIRAIVAGARTITSGEATPTRLDPATLDR